MTPEQFIARWRGNTRTERAAAQHHFLDLCDLLGVDKPTGGDYDFEKSTRKIGDTQGYADVWKRACFAWEYKGDRKNLIQAYAQLKQYADALENPPLLIVSDMQEIRIHTNFTNSIAQQHVIALADLPSVETRELLRKCFVAPEGLRPTATRETVTALAAAGFAAIAVRLRQHNDERRVAHFINKLVFCLFAEDIELLPNRVFADILDEGVKRPDDFVPMLRELFRAMANPNGRFGTAAIPWFNGGLFDDDDVLPLGIIEARALRDAARLDWQAIDPTIFGTLFESGLDDKKRAEMASLFDLPDPAAGAQPRLFANPAANRGVGIHYTDEATIMKIIEPVVLAPLRREWEEIKEEITGLDEQRARARIPADKTRLLNKGRGLYTDFRARLSGFRVLDPACGSGNFLALSLRALKDFDLAVTEDAAALGLPSDDFRVGPEAVLGIEINAYAAELARLTVWITELQWQLHKGLAFNRRPILDKLDGIARGDALLTPSGTEREWPEADVVVGNPPFVGGKRLRKSLRDDYVDRLFAAYRGRVPAEADLVCYWFEKAWERLRVGRIRRVGLVATNSIRGGANRRVLDRITKDGQIFDAWDDEPWVIKGASVRVSLICFAEKSAAVSHLDGEVVVQINSDLTGAFVDVTSSSPLDENSGASFQGVTKGGSFGIEGSVARQWLRAPLNPNARPNSDVLRTTVSGGDLARRSADKWVIDFAMMSEHEASLYEAPFELANRLVRLERSTNRREFYKRYWWRFAERRPGMWRKIGGLTRFIATAKVSRHRFFVWLDKVVIPDNLVIVITRDDDTTFGILSSRTHRAWSLQRGAWCGAGNDPTYTPTSTFETFAFPEGLTPNIPAGEYENDARALVIAEAARELDRLRNAWLNPPDLIRIEPEVVPGYPDRVLPRDAAAEKILKTRTLTNLYNQRPAWLDSAHRDLDAAVAAAYGWPADIPDEDALARLLALNLERAAAGR